MCVKSHLHPPCHAPTHQVHEHEERERGLVRQLEGSQQAGDRLREEAQALRSRLEEAEVQLSQVCGMAVDG